MKEFVGRIVRLSMPTYDETSLFGVSLAYLLVFSFSESFHFTDWKLFDKAGYVIYAIFFLGMAVSILNALIPRDKSTIERKLMLWYAAMANGMSAVWAGAMTLDHGLSLFSIFPILNIINGYILLVLPRAIGLNENNIVNEDASFKNILWVSLAVTFVFFVSERLINNIWPFTLAMCVVYANNLNRVITTEYMRILATG